ncbi:MAG: hypothetical protein LBV26_08470 [Bacteroidales bacterium]|nr:hypothetical protein [Bacteroidales bacterium]
MNAEGAKTVQSNAATVTVSAKPMPVITITAQPAAPAYQWYSNTTASSEGGTAIDGATAASYTLSATLAAGTYYYFAEVSVEGATAVRSNAVTVTVGAKPAVVIGKQKNTITAGVGDVVYFDISATGVEISDQASVLADKTDAWYAAAEGGTALPKKPEGIGQIGYNSESGRLQVLVNRFSTAGDLYFTVTYEGVTSNRVKTGIGLHAFFERGREMQYIPRSRIINPVDVY